MLAGDGPYRSTIEELKSKYAEERYNDWRISETDKVSLIRLARAGPSLFHALSFRAGFAGSLNDG